MSSRELEEVTLEMYAAISNADPSYFERHLTSDRPCIIIGTAPDEWWDAAGPALEAIREQMKSAGSGVNLVAGDLRADSEGNVGWIADRPVLSIGAASVACRHTAVFVRKDGRWQMVQQHFSIGVKNEEAFGAEAAKLQASAGSGRGRTS